MLMYDNFTNGSYFDIGTCETDSNSWGRDATLGRFITKSLVELFLLYSTATLS
jgi:hypothetical protein